MQGMDWYVPWRLVHRDVDDAPGTVVVVSVDGQELALCKLAENDWRALSAVCDECGALGCEVSCGAGLVSVRCVACGQHVEQMGDEVTARPCMVVDEEVYILTSNDQLK